jgi:hypothetical protein
MLETRQHFFYFFSRGPWVYWIHEGMTSFFKNFFGPWAIVLTSSKRAKVERVVPQRLVKTECDFAA